MEWVKRDPRYFPSLIGVFVLALFIYKFENLTNEIKRYFVPSVAVYILATSLLAYLQTMIFIRQAIRLSKEGNGPQPIPDCIFWTIVVLHLLFLGCLIGYNLYRGSL